MEHWHELLCRIHEGDEEGEAYHGPATKTVLRSIDARVASARPIPAAHTIWEIVQHMLAWRELACGRLAGDARQPMSDEQDWAAVPDTSENAWNDLLARLNANQERLIRLVASLDEAKLAEFEALLRFLVHHELHHAGQLALLKKSAAR